MLLYYGLKRVLFAVPTVIVLVSLIFVALQILPGDPVEALVDTSRGNISDEYLQQLRIERGLDQPPHVRYASYMVGLLRGDLGTSWKTLRPVATEIQARLVPTVLLGVAGVAVSLVAGVPAGIMAALQRNRLPDYVLTVLSVTAMAAPSFWLAMLFIYVFAFKLRLFPILGVGDPSDPLSVLHHLMLPAFAIGAYSAGLITRIARSSMLEVLESDYVRTARAKGLRHRRVIYVHALRNALVPVLSMAGVSFVYLLAGSVVIETVFGREGLGTLTLRAIQDRDAPLLQGTMVVFIIMIVCANVVLDILYAVVDPRITHE